jgi:hypothetical protein
MEQTTLSVADLISLRNLIDAACSRGAFKAGEMTSIGELYNRLNTFVEHAQLQIDPQSQSDQDQTNQTQGEQNA